MTTTDSVSGPAMTAGAATLSGPTGPGSGRRRVLGAARWARTRPRRRSRPAVVLAGAWVGLQVFAALFAQWLPLHDPGKIAGPPNTGLSWSAEFLGTDNIGRSELSRLAFGARASLGVSVMACVVGLVIGALLGVLTAFFKSWLGVVVDIFTNSLLAIPGLLLLLAILMALPATVTTLGLSLGLIFIPAFTRLTRAHASSELAREYVVAARIMGASRFRLMFREILPNSLTPLIAYAALALPSLIVVEGSLSFLGHGLQPPTPSWGAMIAAAQPQLVEHPVTAVVPCVVMFLTVFAFNVLGDALRVKLDVREGQL